MNEFFLKFRPGYAPSRYVFKDPDTARVFEAANEKELILRVISYRQQNELEPIPYLPFVIRNFLCGLPENMGKCTRMKLERSLGTTIKGGITLLKNLLTRQLVSEKEANRRGRICVSCPHNIFPNKGHFVTWSDKAAEQLVGKRKSSYHDELGNCEVCSCVLRAKIWMKDPGVPTAEEKEKMDKVGCWVPQTIAETLAEGTNG